MRTSSVETSDHIHDLRDEIRYAEARVIDATEDYLRATGWRQTKVEFEMLWEKQTADGRVLLVDADIAIALQETMNPPDLRVGF